MFNCHFQSFESCSWRLFFVCLHFTFSLLRIKDTPSEYTGRNYVLAFEMQQPFDEKGLVISNDYCKTRQALGALDGVVNLQVQNIVLFYGNSLEGKYLQFTSFPIELLTVESIICYKIINYRLTLNIACVQPVFSLTPNWLSLDFKFF